MLANTMLSHVGPMINSTVLQQTQAMSNSAGLLSIAAHTETVSLYRSLQCRTRLAEYSPQACPHEE